MPVIYKRLVEASSIQRNTIGLSRRGALILIRKFGGEGVDTEVMKRSGAIQCVVDESSFG